MVKKSCGVLAISSEGRLGIATLFWLKSNAFWCTVLRQEEGESGYYEKLTLRGLGTGEMSQIVLRRCLRPEQCQEEEEEILNLPFIEMETAMMIVMIAAGMLTLIDVLTSIGTPRVGHRTRMKEAKIPGK